MRTIPTTKRADFALEGFVDLNQWSLVAPAIERCLREHPDTVVRLECGRVTGFAPSAYIALAQLAQAAPGRFRLHGWPEAVSRAIVSQFRITQVLDKLVAAMRGASSDVRGQEHRADLDATMAKVATGVAELKRSWFGAACASPAPRNGSDTLP